MFKVRLSWENGNKETKSFEDYNEALWFIGENAEAGFMIWKDDTQMNEADVARDVELVS